MVSDGRYKVKKIWKKLYLGLAILGMFVPLQVNAEEQDTVTLQEENFPERGYGRTKSGASSL